MLNERVTCTLSPFAGSLAAVERSSSRGAPYGEGDWSAAAAMQAAMRLADTGGTAFDAGGGGNRDATAAEQQAVFLPSWVSLLIVTLFPKR